MLILALDTSTEICSVALNENEKTIAEINVPGERDHAQRLFPEMQKLFMETGYALREIGLLAGGLGPGSFTGIRIGLSALEGLAAALKRPVLGIEGLDAMAVQSWSEGALICPMIDARRGEVYACVYRGVSGRGIEKLTESRVWRIEELCDRLLHKNEGVYLTGSGYRKHVSEWEEKLGEKIVGCKPGNDFPHAGAIAFQAWRVWLKNGMETGGRLKPVYMRKPEAEVRWEDANERC